MKRLSSHPPRYARRYGVTAALLAALLAAGTAQAQSGAVDTGGIDISQCNGSCANENSFLTEADVQRIIAQAVAEARARGALATIAVVDRVGNVLGVFRMYGANNILPLNDDFGFVTVTSGRTPLVQGGLENVSIVPDTAAAIAKAITAAYLSSEGNAFTTRTANQIVQEHFNPGELNQPGGPLFGVQFSALPCSDLTLRFDGTGADAGPKRSPLGLSADAGGLPLYKAGTPVGGVGVISDGIYGGDLIVSDFDRDQDELIATAATFGYAAPEGRRADRITVDGKSFRFSDVDFGDLASNPTAAPPYSSIDMVAGGLTPVRGYFDPPIIVRGTAFGQPESGIVPADPNLFPGLDGFVLVDENGNERYPPIAGTDGLLTREEVLAVLQNALAVANRTRAQIRQPLGSQMRASISVVDTNGVVVGLIRTRDAPVFGLDVSLQKARTAAFFSGTKAAERLFNAAPVRYFSFTPEGRPFPVDFVSLSSYVFQLRQFLGLPTALADGAFAFSDRAGGNLSRPFFPDGLRGYPPGPLSKPFDRWSPFTDGLQLDISLNQIVAHVGFLTGGLDDIGFNQDVPQNCTGIPELPNGIQIFPGSVPIYKGSTLVGAIGISGDGIDQDDMISFLGTHNAGLATGTINNAPVEIRADQIEVPAFGINLRYVQCPQAPFLDSTEQTPCNGK